MALTETPKIKRRRPTRSTTQDDRSQDVLVALRRIIRATDLHSKHMLKESGLTIPQVVVLQSVHDLGEVTTGQISQHVSLSQGTVTNILDRLESRNFVERYRSSADRRVVHTRLTKTGRAAVRKAPSLLHQRFVSAFAELPASRQEQIIEALDEIAHMMGAKHLDAAPLLDVLPPPGGQNAKCKP